MNILGSVLVHPFSLSLRRERSLLSLERSQLFTLLTSIEVLFTESFAGLFLAAHDLKIEWIVIKGVSNFADGRESKSWKEFASVMAASLTAHILSNPIVFQNWPHYEGEYAVA